VTFCALVAEITIHAECVTLVEVTASGIVSEYYAVLMVMAACVL